MKPGVAQPHQSSASSPRCSYIPHTRLFCPCLLYTYQELRSGETSFLPRWTQPGRRWFYCSVTQGKFLRSIIVRNTEVGTAAVQFCPDHPHLTPVSQQWKVNPTMTVWAQFMKTHQFYSTFFASLTSTGRWWNTKQPLPATSVSPPSGHRMTQSRRHCIHPGAQGHLRPPQELSRETQRQQLSWDMSSKTAQGLSESSAYKAG